MKKENITINFNCPNCGKKLKEIKTPSVNKGYAFLIDQCVNCGGMWFDKSELFQIPNNIATKIDKISKSKFEKNVKIRESIFCPKDKFLLIPTIDASVPKSVDLRHCPKCFGIWLNKGDLHRFKNEIKERINKNKMSPSFSRMALTRDLGQDQNDEQVDFLKKVIGKILRVQPVIYETMNYLDSKKPYVLEKDEVELLKSVPVNMKAEMFKEIRRSRREVENEKNKTIRFFFRLISIIRMLVFRI